jgi:hypothetical protein
MLVGMENSLGIRNPHGYGFGQNFIPVMGMGFLTSVFFLRGYGFGQQRVFTIAIFRCMIVRCCDASFVEAFRRGPAARP